MGNRRFAGLNGSSNGYVEEYSDEKTQDVDFKATKRAEKTLILMGKGIKRKDPKYL